MTIARSINSPGIELHEVDRSTYSSIQDNSLPNAPTVLVTGVAAKGKNYVPQWINSKSTFLNLYGAPESEEERYFYNGCSEVLDRGGVCIGCKLSYDNVESQDGGRFTYCDYELAVNPNWTPASGTGSRYIKKIGNKKEIEVIINKLGDLNTELIKVLNFVGKYSEYSIKYDLQKFSGLKAAISQLASEYDLDDEVKNQIRELREQLKSIADKLNTVDYIFREILFLDPSLTSCIELQSSQYTGKGSISMEQFDNLRTGMKSGIKNKIRIVDISRSYHTKANFNCVSSTIGETSDIENSNDALGIFPVLVTAPNAMFFQGMFNGYTGDNGDSCISSYNPIKTLSAVAPTASGISVDLSQLDSEAVLPCQGTSFYDQTISKVTSNQFPTITFRDYNHLQTEYLKQIGLVVLLAYVDDSNSKKVNYKILESFVGSLDKTAKSQNGASIFIDNIVNTNSRYVNIFSNVETNILKQVDFIYMKDQTSSMLGFYKKECEKKITPEKTIIDSLNQIFNLCKDPNTIPLDLIIDAGVSNIAQYYESKRRAGDPDDFVWMLTTERAKIDEQTSKWRQVVNKFDSFCQYTRRDCMFIADGLRPFCLIGDEKLVRSTNVGSSVANNIIPLLKHISGINSSFSAGYCNWFYGKDGYTGELFWCPPSIKAVSIYIYCDTYFHTWDAPAGMTRGKVPNVVDTAFNPAPSDTDQIYLQSWNYAINYPITGIIVEGQKTFQANKTALDRINVRRLLLGLEKSVIKIGRRFLYEGNTPYIRQKFVDSIRQIFENAVSGNGISEYAIKCDDELNTPQAIENHELRCKIALKPIKTIEYIILDFICTNQSASVTEEVMK